MPTDPTRPADLDQVPSRARRTRTRTPATRRAALLDAAQRLFLARGIAATSIDAIAAEAQVAKGTFYLYFASRDALVAALQQRFVADFCADVAARWAREPQGDWHGRLAAWFDVALAILLERRLLHDMVFHEAGGACTPVLHDNPAVAQLADFLRAGMAAGAWRTDAPRMAVMMFHAMHGLADQAASCPAGERASLAGLLTATFGAALRG